MPLPRPGQPPFTGRHELYALPCLPESPEIKDDKLEAHFVRRIVDHLRRVGAPDEHLVRLGLTEAA